MLTADAASTDPVCSKSPNHHMIQDALSEAISSPDLKEFPLIFRTDKNSQLLDN